jgi:threonine dehydratase
VEPGGAVGVAALLSGRVRENGSIVALVSGGNIDHERLFEYVGAGGSMRE